MPGDIDKEQERLRQSDFLKQISRNFKSTDLIPVWWRVDRPGTYYSVYSGFVPNAKVEHALARTSWDLLIGDGVPEACKYSGPDGKHRVEYLRFGNDEGIEPLVISRYFHGMREPYVEISEEFRLFHQLYHDRMTDRYIKIDETGNETEVAIVEAERIRIRLKEIRQFCAVKEMHLAVYFDSIRYSTLTPQELGEEEGGRDAIRDGLLTYNVAYGDYDGACERRAFSSLLGKRLFAPLPKTESAFWGFAEEEPREPVEFVIDVDENGNDILNTSDENRLSNYFCANAGKPHYLTPVFFRRTVLDKYYQQPEKFSVEDGYLRCGGLWGMTMDNHHDDYVVAWLGDLGRDLPYSERLHWRSHNIAPCGRMSNVFFKRQICAEATDSKQPDVQLQYRFPAFSAHCEKRLGWSPFLPLADEDQHYFSALRIPATNGQKEFDDLVLGLTKALVDSLNEAEFVKRIRTDERQGVKGGITRFERALAVVGAEGYQEHVQFLRDLQDLRSTGVAHRKGRSYEKAGRRFKTDTEPLSKVFREMLVAALNLLEYLQDVVDAGLLDATPED